MKISVLLLLLFSQFGVCQLAQAELGQKESVFSERYGRPSREYDAIDRELPLVEGGVTHTYHHAGWRIRVGFISGISIREEFSKIPSKGHGLKIDNEDLANVLRAEGNKGLMWRNVSNVAGEELPFLMREFFSDAWISCLWVRSDGNAAASMGHNRMRLRLDCMASLQYERFVDSRISF